MGIQKMNRRQTNGKCGLCGGVFDKVAMEKHIESCRKREIAPEKISAQERKTFLIKVEGTYNPEYWMYLETNTNATLEDLDSLLRETWLECCGHMSAFTIQKIRYIAGSGIVSMWVGLGFKPDGKRNMNIALGKVLAPKLKFYHEYDFGTTTELVLKVVSEHEETLEHKPIRILVRNEAPQILCYVCGKIATQVCTECIYEDTGWLCDKCACKHECDEDMLLPVVNSLRVGMCGYTG